MPVYCFTSDDGETIEELFPIGKAPESFRRKRDGKSVKYTRDYAAEGNGFHDTPGNWPMYSDALGCHPRQAKTIQANLAKRGLRVEFDKTGRMKLDNPKHRREVCHAMGVFDRNAGYSDPAPRNYTGPIENY